MTQLAARLTAEQAGWVLNCQSRDITVLVNARLLKRLGNLAQNGTKFFARLIFCKRTRIVPGSSRKRTLSINTGSGRTRERSQRLRMGIAGK